MEKERIKSLYVALILVRLVVPCIVQSGYVFPDEFFQSPEIMARDVFHINSTVTWEWYEDYPVRSPLSAFLSSGLPFLLLKQFSSYIDVSPTLLLVFPRVFLTFFTLLSFDLPVYVITQKLAINSFDCLVVLSTSYVTMIFASRPFSNTLETGISAILMMCLIQLTDRVSIHGITKKNILMFLFIGGFTSFGVFCRQTFLIFSIVPYLGYLIFNIKFQQTTILPFLVQIICIAMGFSLCTCIFIIVDSWYFNYSQYRKIVITHWNFILYNFRHAQDHGKHPFFTHFIVNMPLLFGPLSLLFFIKIGAQVKKIAFILNDEQIKHTTFYKCVLTFHIFIPLFILSYIPHQEPRFLMPLLIPLVLLFSSHLLSSKLYLYSWLLWNSIGFIFYGIFHQGGVVTSLFYLHKTINNEMQISKVPLCYHVVYHHTYKPPSHLLAWTNLNEIDSNRLFLHDLAGSTPEKLRQTLNEIGSKYCDKNKNKVKIFIRFFIKGID